jgi:hypothetical protein
MVRDALVFGFLAVAFSAGRLEAQVISSPQPSVLYQSSVVTRDELVAASDTTKDKRIAAAVGFGLVGAIVGGLIAGGGDDTFLPSTPTIIVFGVVGAIAGYVTSGKSTD